MKKINWKKVTQHSLSKNCFWANQKDNFINSAEKAVFDELSELFSLPNKSIGETSNKKSDTDLRVLDNKAAQNLLITLRGLFKSSSHKQIKEYILQCDTNNLSTFVIEALIKYLPPPHAMKELQKMMDEGEELPDIEKFVASIGDIERLLPRLDCIKFVLVYDDMVENLEPHLRATSAACNEIISSEKFGRILKLILRIGNHMNSGSNIGEAIGFDLTALNKLKDVKTSDNKRTLLNYMVRTIETLYPELLTFRYELYHVEKAARMNVQSIEETVQKLSELSQSLQNELNKSDSCLPMAMSKFARESQQQIEKIKDLLFQMRNNYRKVAEHYAFDDSKLSLGEFFMTVLTFMKSFAEERAQCSPEKKKPDEAQRCVVKLKRKLWSEEGLYFQFSIN